MTGAEFYTYLKLDFKRTDKEDEIFSALTDVISDIREEYKLEEDKEINYTLGIDALGEYSFTLPDDFGFLIGDIKILEDNDSYKLEKISKDEYDRLLPDPEYSDVDKEKPTHFCIYADQVFLYPVPDKLTYYYEWNYSTDDEAAITTSTGNVPYSSRNRKMLKCGVLAEIYKGLGMDNEAVKWGSEFRRLVERKYARDKENTSNNMMMSPDIYG